MEFKLDDYNVPIQPSTTNKPPNSAFEATVNPPISTLEKKPQKLRPKLNSSLLLSDRGFKYLRQNIPKFIHAQDSTIKDFDTLMLHYREWAHYLFPSYQFEDFVDKAEKECKHQYMRLYLNALRKSQTQQTEFNESEYTINAAADEATTVLRSTSRSKKGTEGVPGNICTNHFSDDEESNDVEPPSDRDLEFIVESNTDTNDDASYSDHSDHHHDLEQDADHQDNILNMIADLSNNPINDLK